MKDPIYKSLGLHLVVFLLLMIEIPNIFSNKDMVISQVPIIIDLNDVKISEMTNLPPKATFDKEDKQASTEKRKEENFTNDSAPEEKSNTKEEADTKKEAKEEVKEEPQEEATPPKQDFLVAPQPQKPQKAVEKKITEKVRPVPSKKPAPPKSKPADKKTPELANPLKSLLASVESMEKNIGDKNQSATIKEGTAVNHMGVEGGVGGSYFSELSISETDAIAGRLRGCWNLDPGAMGAKDMIIEIRAFLNQDGTVRDVKIIDTSRYGSDPHFRSVADSARRAVFICAPYKIFAEKYADKYDLWKTIFLRFNPLDGKVN